MSPGFKYSPSLSSAFQGIGFILRLQGWTLTALGLPNPHLRLKSRRKRTFFPSIVCMEIISLTGSHWSQSGPWTFPCGQGMSLALSKCQLRWGWGAERGGRTIPPKGRSGCYHQKEKGCRMARRLQTSLSTNVTLWMLLKRSCCCFTRIGFPPKIPFVNELHT